MLEGASLAGAPFFYAPKRRAQAWSRAPPDTR
jgi:hypothetical protein